VGDLVQHGDANLLAQLVRVGKIPQQRLRENCDFVWENGRVKAGAIGQWDALVEPVKRVIFGVESGVEKKLFSGPFLDHDFDIVQLFTKLSREVVENPGDLFSDLVFIHQ